MDMFLPSIVAPPYRNSVTPKSPPARSANLPQPVSPALWQKMALTYPAVPTNPSMASSLVVNPYTPLAFHWAPTYAGSPYNPAWQPPVTG